MLQTSNRLTKVRDFNLIMKYGRWANGSFLDLKYLELAKITNYFPKKEDPDKFKKQLKLAITVGLKVSKSAVKRNRVKRQIREVLRLLIKDGRITGGRYLLFVARKNILEKNYAEISEEVMLLLKRSNIYLSS
ncbi:MAG: ribonuclease P protein component [Candidatus Magasanikbacteria bacterium]|nr:ribonuclease P protein component [Candidatus Magasanikbacteria bacterium]